MSKRELVCEDLARAIDRLRAEGFRLDCIYPADDPKAAVLRRAGEEVRVLLPDAPPLLDGLPPFRPELILARASSSSARGRAGMLYRDLIPRRLGGRYIASHITIPDGGPVDDWVHYHRVALQIIVVRQGWVRVVYEDQGAPFVMNPGDLVVQPPGIRHRVLESSPGLEVIEISAPALHETFADHELELPNRGDGERRFAGQSFLHHVASAAPWTTIDDMEIQETGVGAATEGLADVRTVRRGGGPKVSFAPHRGELVFGFVLAGTAEFNGQSLSAADALTVPPGDPWQLSDLSDDFTLLHVRTALLD